MQRRKEEPRPARPSRPTRAPRAARPSQGAVPAVLIRAARQRDHLSLSRMWLEVESLHARLAPDFFAAAQAGRASLSSDELRRLLADRDGAILVAEVDRQVVGCIQLQLYDTPRRPHFVSRRRVNIERLVVEAAVRRRGVGQRLMQAAARWAADRSATQLLLTVWEGNHGAERFYRALGYRPVSQVLGLDLP